jgi:hypothetical protein
MDSVEYLCMIFIPIFVAFIERTHTHKKTFLTQQRVKKKQFNSTKKISVPRAKSAWSTKTRTTKKLHIFDNIAWVTRTRTAIYRHPDQPTKSFCKKKIVCFAKIQAKMHPWIAFIERTEKKIIIVCEFYHTDECKSRCLFDANTYAHNRMGLMKSCQTLREI